MEQSTQKSRKVELMKIKVLKNIFTKKDKQKNDDELMKQFQIVYDDGNKLLNQLLNGGIKHA